MPVDLAGQARKHRDRLKPPSPPGEEEMLSDEEVGDASLLRGLDLTQYPVEVLGLGTLLWGGPPA